MTACPPTIHGLQQAIAGGEFTAQQAIALQRRHAQKLDASLNAAVDFLPDDLFEIPAATKPEITSATLSAARPAGPLAGVALAHKDIFNLPGSLPGLGCEPAGSFLRRTSANLAAATVISRLTRAGATHLATLAMAEYACGATGANANLPQCVNPLNAAAVVGGSSSGSAAAVASGMVYGSLGTDTAGSVRIPAATCGVLGLKTTHGLLPLDGVFPLAPGLDSVGVLARTADDLRQILLAASDNIENSGDGLTPAFAGRAAVCIPESELDGAVAQALHTFAGVCGLPVRSAIAQHALLTQLSEIVLHAQAAQTHRTALLDGTASAAVKAIALAGFAMPPEWLQDALAQRASHLRDFVASQFNDCDILVLPALPAPVPDWHEVTPGHAAFNVRKLLGLHRFMGFVNYLGLPSLVVPITRDARGLPISVQLLGRPFHELTLLQFASGLQPLFFSED
jgi:Asp-tRNA(Asn)/Glu-tRNA(Gln) amidotransferase A subunit family amidase